PGPDQAHGKKQWLGGDQQGGQSGAAGNRPGGEPADDPRGRGDAATAPADQRIPNGQGRVLTRRQDDDKRNPEEGGEVHAPTLPSPPGGGGELIGFRSGSYGYRGSGLSVGGLAVGPPRTGPRSARQDGRERRVK